MKRLLLLFTVFLLCNFAQGQKDAPRRVIDSLLNCCVDSPIDTVRCDALIAIGRSYIQLYKYDSLIHYGKLVLKAANELNSIYYITKAYKLLDAGYYLSGNKKKCLKYLLKSNKLLLLQRQHLPLADNLANMSIIYEDLGKYDEALECSKQSLKYFTQCGDSSGISNSYNNMASTYRLLGNLGKSVDYNLMALKIQELQHDSIGIATSLHNLANKYVQLGDTDEALAYFERSLEIRIKANLTRYLYITYSAIAEIYLGQNDYEKSLEYLELSRLQCVRTNNVEAYYEYQCYKGQYFYSYYIYYGEDKITNKNEIAPLNLKKLMHAYFDSALVGYRLLEIDKEIVKTSLMKVDALFLDKDWQTSLNVLTLIKGQYMEQLGLLRKCDINQQLSICYEHLGKDKLALYHHKKFIYLKDSLYREEVYKNITKKSLEYEFQKEKELQQAEQQHIDQFKAAKAKQKNIVVGISVGSLVIALSLLLVLYNRFHKIKLQKRIINDQKESLATQNNNITQSINYAKHIQSSMTPDAAILNDFFAGTSIVYMPRDIVSGDFYWFSRISEHKIIWAVADCTGHGVPGGFMSMIGHAFLDKFILDLSNMIQPVFLTILETG